MKKVKSKDYSKKIKSAVFISGRGTNFKSLLKFSKKKISPIKINLLITDNKNAKGIFFAKKNNIKFKSFSYNQKPKSESKILKELKKNNIKFVMLAGFMKILSKKFINKFQGKIVNIHPSLLPKYKGLHAHKKVLINKDKFSGCTVHFVSKKLDSGKIILQKRVKVLKNDNVKKLENRILRVENKLYPLAIKKIFN